MGLGLRALSFAPLWSNEETLLFSDVRGHGAHHDGIDFSWGLGIRHRLESDWIVGGYGYFDRTHMRPETAYDQAMLGGELLSIDWTLRLNGYLPETDTQVLGGGQAVLVGDKILLRHPIEGAYRGTDFEVGYLRHDWFNGALELRGCAGGFYFHRSGDGFDPITGPSVRSELRLFDLPWLRRDLTTPS